MIDSTEENTQNEVEDMSRLSTQEILKLQEIKTIPESSFQLMIRPVLTSPAIKSQNTLGIEIRVQRSEKQDFNTKIPPSIILKNKNDPSSWYQLQNYEYNSFLLKVKFNMMVWDHTAFFSAPALFLIECKNVLVVALSDDTIHFIDTELGCCCFPPILIGEKIKYFSSYSELITCITHSNRLFIWQITPPNRVDAILIVQYFGELPNIKNVRLTNEIVDQSVSPIIETNEFSIRYSQTRCGWVSYSQKVPDIFNKKFETETIADVETQFSNSLLLHEEKTFYQSFQQLVRCYLYEANKSHVIVLIHELMSHMAKGVEQYCGINARELLESTLSIISETDPNLTEKIKADELYQIAINPPVKENQIGIKNTSSVINSSTQQPITSSMQKIYFQQANTSPQTENNEIEQNKNAHQKQPTLKDFLSYME